MSEEDVRGGLKDAVAEEPPLDFDADALVTTARQQVKRRRALMAVGVATVAVAVAAVALPAAFGRGTAPVANRPASPVTTSTTTTTTSLPTSPAEPHRYTANELRRRSKEMTSHLGRIVPAVLTQASAFDAGEFGGEATGDFHDGQMYVNAPVSFTIANARYSIFVTLWVAGTPEPTFDTVCAEGCTELGEKDGGSVVSKTEALSNHVITTVYHFRRDGSVVQVAGYNYDMAATGSPVYMPTIPMTEDQLKALATDAGLGL